LAQGIPSCREKRRKGDQAKVRITSRSMSLYLP
jgi:hypothetical protein